MMSKERFDEYYIQARDLANKMNVDGDDKQRVINIIISMIMCGIQDYQNNPYFRKDIDEYMDRLSNR